MTTKNKIPIVVGLNAWHADASAAIFISGKLIVAIEEERLTRIKHAAGFPSLALLFCLKETGLQFEDIDLFVIGRDPSAKFYKKIKFLISQGINGFKGVRERLKNRSKVQSLAGALSNLSGLKESFFKAKIIYAEHHRSHLASAFFASPYEEAACISIDGSGDFTTTMMGKGKGANIEVLQSLDFPNSMGIFYTMLTQWLGFPNYGDEYKVMGMAPYGRPVHADKLNQIIQPTDDGFFKLIPKYFIRPGAGIISYGKNDIPEVATLFTSAVEALLGPARKADEPLTDYHHDVASSVQHITEQIIFHMLNHLHKITGSVNLCLAGGVAQNSVANGKITSNTGFKHVFVPSAGHDAGISMGAGMYHLHHTLKLPRSYTTTAYTGSKFSDEEIFKILSKENVDFTKPDDDSLYDIVTDCIINGGVIGWFTGRAEFGPRALGGRSILADPRRNDAKELLNNKIKRRESFRPFAPSILAEHVGDFFMINEPVPFMEKVFPIKKDKQHLIPAVTHVDGTGRLQSVVEETSPAYYQLIKTFYSKTGIPILLNTSFNENEPIVNTPLEALRCFQRTKMDMLVLEKFIIRRKN